MRRRRASERETERVRYSRRLLEFSSVYRATCSFLYFLLSRTSSICPSSNYSARNVGRICFPWKRNFEIESKVIRHADAGHVIIHARRAAASKELYFAHAFRQQVGKSTFPVCRWMIKKRVFHVTQRSLTIVFITYRVSSFIGWQRTFRSLPPVLPRS